MLPSIRAPEKRPRFLPARHLVLRDFLPPHIVERLTRSTLRCRARFAAGEVVPAVGGSQIDADFRRSHVLMDMPPAARPVVAEIEARLPEALRKLGYPSFTVSRTDAQITASGHGDFFRLHNDTGAGELESREITFVYYFHCMPKAFRGGELRIHDSRLQHGDYVSDGQYQTIVPEHNQIVFFPSSLMHEVTKVRCISGAFRDARFTVNGWCCR